MWRSFLARSQPLVSHIQRGPCGCSAAAGDTLVAAALAVAGAHPRAYASSAAEAGAANSLRTSRRHLYVVLDEMKTGLSIYKLDVDDLDGGDEDAVSGMDSPPWVPQQTTQPCQLPEPILRLGHSLVGSWAHFSAVGGKIVVTGNSRRRDHRDQEITLVYDTKTARLGMEQPPPTCFTHRGCHVVAVGNKLYRFGGGSGWPPHYLSEQQAVEFHGGHESHNDDRTMLSMRGQIMEWTWKNVPSLPAGGGHVHSCAVHPDGRTLFVSRGPVTFSLDTEQEGGEWTRRGDWAMPFHGRAYYDAHLDAWVGIGPRNDTQDLNYLCSCQVPNLAGDQPRKPLLTPEWRLCKEELTFLEGASSCALLHTGRGRFCLVEARPVVPLAEGAKDSQCNRCTMHNGNDHLLHVTIFCAKHGRDGELVMAPCRPGRSYLVPRYAEDADDEGDPVENPPAAFWI
ncbi:hypothetical protein VPH35_101707 [Triticum aestivum]